VTLYLDGHEFSFKRRTDEGRYELFVDGSASYVSVKRYRGPGRGWIVSAGGRPIEFLNKGGGSLTRYATCRGAKIAAAEEWLAGSAETDAGSDLADLESRWLKALGWELIQSPGSDARVQRGGRVEHLGESWWIMNGSRERGPCRREVAVVMEMRSQTWK